MDLSNIIFSITFLHAYLQYVCNITVKYWKDSLKAVIGVYFTKYALLQFIQYMHCSKIGLVQNAVNLSKILFSASYLFMHVFNMSVTFLPRDIRKALGVVDFIKYALLTIITCFTKNSNNLHSYPGRYGS